MTGDGVYEAVLDRFEDELAVLLLERDGETVGDVAVDREDLPRRGRRVDAVFRVHVEGGEVVSATYEADETERRRGTAQDRFDRLARRPGETGEDESDEAESAGADGGDDEPDRK